MIRVGVVAGRTYVIQVSVRDATRLGSYRLDLGLIPAATPQVPDSAGNTPELARPLALLRDVASVAGAIDAKGDLDVYSLVAPRSGGLTIRRTIIRAPARDSPPQPSSPPRIPASTCSRCAVFPIASAAAPQ